MRKYACSTIKTARKVEATITWPPYVIALYKRQEAQNVGFGKKKLNGGIRENS
jgi:hypothetical protein